jgi:hypothetical protein
VNVASQVGGYTLRRMALLPAYGRWGGLELIGARPTGTLPGAMLDVETLWRATSDSQQAVIATLSLRGERNVQLAAVPLGARYPPFRWRPGEFVRERARTRIPPDMPDGRYEVWMAVAGGAEARIGEITLRARDRSFIVSPSDRPVNRSISGKATLLGYSVERADGGFQVELVWRVDGTLDGDYAIFVHAANQRGIVRAQADGPPAGGAAPTGTWLPGEIVVDRKFIPTTTEPTLIVVGMYEPESGRRLPTQTGDSLLLGPLEATR